MNLPFYVLMAGLGVWGLIVSVALSQKDNNCNGFEIGDKVVVQGKEVTLVKRTGVYGEHCNYWVKVGDKEMVMNFDKE